MASVVFKDASRIYPGTTSPAVDKLNLTVKDGEFLVLVGPSGCGKSTSLRMLAGLEEIDNGAIFIGDRDVTNIAPKDRDIAMVFQSYALYPHMTVAENMGFALKIAPLSISSKPASMRSDVDFPQPDGPTRTKNSPSLTVRFNLSTAGEVVPG